MKKIAMIVVLMVSLITLFACTKSESSYTFSFYDYMDTYISVNLYAPDQATADTYQAYIDSVYKEYQELTTNYVPLSQDSPYLENIYSINQKNNQVIEIDYDLYVLIQESESIKALTDGYFDISIGEIINVWKSLLVDDSTGYLFSEIPETVFQNALTEATNIVLEPNVIELSESNGHYYIQVKSTHAQLDLGAISKGYATDIVYKYLQEQGVKNFSISAGSSSIALGENKNRDQGIYNVAMASPIQDTTGIASYGMIYVKDIGVTTSGDYEQYATYQGLRYHHIVSPKTQKPMQYYHTVTVLGQDLGMLDALSTALFSMPPDVLDQWLADHQDALGIEVLIFNYDTTITTHLKDTVFEENQG